MSKSTNEYQAIVEAYRKAGKEAVFGKGGVWVRGEGFRSLAQARRETGVNLAQARGPRRKPVSIFLP